MLITGYRLVFGTASQRCIVELTLENGSMKPLEVESMQEFCAVSSLLAHGEAHLIGPGAIEVRRPPQ
jgi:hypothetical protein